MIDFTLPAPPNSATKRPPGFNARATPIRTASGSSIQCKAALEKIYAEIKAGKKPYKLQLVGLELGGKPIEEYAPDFWLISNEGGGDPVGFITSPWYHPEKKQNIAMGYVPFDGTLNANGLPKNKVGTKYKVHLPAKYSDTPGTPVDAVVVNIPFKESFNANTREVVKG